MLWKPSWAQFIPLHKRIGRGGALHDPTNLVPWRRTQRNGAALHSLGESLKPSPWIRTAAAHATPFPQQRQMARGASAAVSLDLTFKPGFDLWTGGHCGDEGRRGGSGNGDAACQGLCPGAGLAGAARPTSSRSTCCAALEALGPPVAAVHGIVDSVELRHLLPAERVVEVGEARLALAHDVGLQRGSLRLALRAPATAP